MDLKIKLNKELDYIDNILKKNADKYILGTKSSNYTKIKDSMYSVLILRNFASNGEYRTMLGCLVKEDLILKKYKEFLRKNEDKESIRLALRAIVDILMQNCTITNT